VQLSGTTTNVYLKVADDGDVSPPVFNASDEAGLRELIGTDDPGALTVEPTLVSAARSLGLVVQDPPEGARRSRAAIAVFMAWGQRGLASLGSEIALRMIHAATEFWNARPWTTWRDDQPLAVTLTGTFESSYEGSVFGEREEGYGLALYDDRGSLRRLRLLQESGAHDEARRLAGVGVLLDDKPEYAVRALQSAAQVPKVPIPVRSGPEGAGVPRAEEAVSLIAALLAVAQLSSTARDVQIGVDVGEIAVTARVVAPPVALKN
jgi:hypothetical protein